MSIRKYGSTFYIGLLWPFSIKPVQIEISIFTLTSTNAKLKNMLQLKTKDIEKKSVKSCKTGVILVIWYFTVLLCSSSSSSG